MRSTASALPWPGVEWVVGCAGVLFLLFAWVVGKFFRDEFFEWAWIKWNG